MVGDAANKLGILTVDGINYSEVWELLIRAYEVKRVLVSRHLSLMMNLPVLNKETTSGLTKLADEMQQHVASLKTLGVAVGDQVIVHLLETRLPRSALER